MIFPDELAKTVKIPIRIVDGRAEYFYGGPFPKLHDVSGDIIVPAFAVVEKPFAEEFFENDDSELLPAGTIVVVNVRIDTAETGLCTDVECGPLKGNVAVKLLEPLYLWHRGTKSSVLDPCKCMIPCTKEEASSLNHAYTIISKRFETERQTNTGNVFKKVYYKNGDIWERLERLRDKFDARFEQRYVSNRRQGIAPLVLADSQLIDQSVIWLEDDCRMTASINAEGLTLEETEFRHGAEQDTKQTVRTRSPNKVLFELIKERFTTTTDFVSWLDKKGIPIDARSGVPKEAAEDEDVWKEIAQIFEAEVQSNSLRAAQINSGSALVEDQWDAQRQLTIDGKTSKRIDEFLAAGWIHVNHYLIRRPTYPRENGPLRNIPMRIRLKDFSPSKRQRRITKKNTDLDIQVEPFSITSEEEELFHRHKTRFTSPPTSIFNIVPPSSLTEMRKITVTDEGRLIAVSYLDVNRTSTFSIYGMFEPTIEWRSLGILTVLKEIEFSILSGKEFYYCGFVYDQPSCYDYKKYFLGLELFDWKGNWIAADQERNSEMPSLMASD